MTSENLRKNIRSILSLMLVGFLMIWLLLILILGYANPAFIDRTTATLFGIIGGAIIGYYFSANHTTPNSTNVTGQSEVK